MNMVWQMAVDEEVRRRSEGAQWRRVGARARAARILRALDDDSTR